MGAAVMTSSPFFQPVSGIPPFQPIAGGVFSMGPELAPWGPSDQFLFAFAVGTDQALWFAKLDGFTTDVDTPATWSGWRSLGGVVMSPPRGVRSGESSVDVFGYGRKQRAPAFGSSATATGSTILRCSRTQLRLRARAERIATRLPPGIGGRLAGIRASRAAPHLHPILGVAWRRPPRRRPTRSCSASWTMRCSSSREEQIRRSGAAGLSNGSWREWTSLGHILASPPHAVVAAKETLAVFALGIDSAIWYTMGGEWQSLGGTFSAAPYAVANGRSIHVFAADAESALSWRTWDGNAWSNWQSLGGILMSRPIADCPAPHGLPYVFTLGTDSGVWRRRSADGSDWFDWESLGIGLLSLPATTIRSPSPEFQFRALAALGPDHQVWFQEDDF